MSPDNDKGHLPWMHILMTGILLTVSLLSFYAFTRENRQRILDRNTNYIEDVTIQTANRINDMLQTRKSSLNVLAITVMETITEPNVDTELLLLLQETSVFDYVEFVDTTGCNHNAYGVISDSSDRENYLEGMKGHTGISLIFNSRITHETLANFYTPIYFNGEIIGVLNGMYREETLQDTMSTELFGISAKSYLCMRDGTVISSCGDSSAPENILTGLRESAIVEAEDLTQIEEAFENHQIYNYTYHGTAGPGNATLAPLADSDWMFLQTFPSTLTSEMESDANASGVKLESRLIILFLIYIIWLITQSFLRHRRILSEKKRLGWIITGILPLFSRLVILDYRENTYEYVENTQKDIAPKGALSALEAYMAPRYIDEDPTTPFVSLLSRESIQKHLESDTPYLRYEYRIRWQEERWENVAVLCLKRRENVPVMVLFAIQDVTAMKKQDLRTRQALQDAFLAAEDANRAKTDFLSHMSHDMRTPMNAIMGMTSVALMHLDEPARLKDCLDKISLSSRRLLSMINNVLDISKMEDGKIIMEEKEFCLPDVFTQAITSVRPQAEDKSQNLEVLPFQITHEVVLGDPARLRQVLLNILENAVKYTPHGGHVRFQAKELPSKIVGSAYYQFIVEDNGIGMEPEFIPEIFELFARSKTSQVKHMEGVGLGLPISRAIVRLMNGDIGVESKMGKGSRFTVWLHLKCPAVLSPPSTDVDVPTRETDRTGLEARCAAARILLVEDNDLNTEIALELLESTGVRVETARDGQVAVEMMEKCPLSYYDLIFMDIQMPRKNGYEATRAIRSLDREDAKIVPIVAMSANAFANDIKNAMDAGMNDHIAKPVSLKKLLDALDKWLPVLP